MGLPKQAATSRLKGRKETMQCKGKIPSGRRCGRPASIGSEWCLLHDPSPEARKAAKAQQKKGGQRRHPVRTKTVLPPEERSPLAIVEAAIQATFDLPSSIQRNHALGNLAMQLLKAQVHEDHEQRIEALEREALEDG